ncbi:MAG: CpsB/CapC family capsule biosynthesis tyrosine phosphatase [Gemmatimonadota bacterium]
MIVKQPMSLVDIHSHLVPGVDDGAKHVAGVVASVERMEQAGIRRIVTTPHIRGSITHEPERAETRLATVTDAYETARDALASSVPEVEYLRGHEVLVDIPEPDFSDPRIRMAGTSFVLVEWPRLSLPPATSRVLRWIRDQGYRPIVAHPERYHGVADRIPLLQEWREAGAYLQVNYGSFVGRYGAEPQRAAFRILELGLADYLASDFHGQSGLKLYKREAWDVLTERDGAELLTTLCRTNPTRLIDDLEPVPVVPLAPASKLLDRIRAVVRRGDRSVRGSSGGSS